MIQISSSIHTRIENGLELRKEILETALRTTELIQRFKDYKDYNSEKKKLITKFKKDVKELKEVVNNLELKDLPKEYTRELSIPEIKKIIKPSREITREILEKPIIKSEIERELDILRNKISSLEV
jgi:light-regulated signal transduction histidine kinase (bacteriophytochrome)